MKAADIMARTVVTVASGASLAAAARLMVDRGVNALPVVDGGGGVIGVVGIRDVLRVPIPSHNRHEGILRYDSLYEKAAQLETTSVDAVMSRNLVSVGEEELVMEVAAKMANRGVHPILVMKGGRLVGVIGRADIARLLLKLSAEPVDAIAD